MIRLRFDDAELRAILDRGDQVAEAVLAGMGKRLQDEWGQKVFERAQQMVPVQFGVLAGTATSERSVRNPEGAGESGVVEKIPAGFKIYYGGLASGYAAKQHEDESLQHNPPTNEFSYEGPWTPVERRGVDGGVPGEWNPIGGLRGVEGAIWGKPIEWGGDQWRFLHVVYDRRSLRGDHLIKAEATHHWLFGAPHSAYESSVEEMLADLADGGKRIAERLLRHAA